MSAEDGTRTGSPDVENALVAALGFEPTAGMSDEAATVLIDDGSGNALDWSGSEAGSAESAAIDVQEGLLSPDGADTGPSDPSSTAKATDSMTPPKGKGKGPRTYKSSKPTTAVGDEPEAGVNGADPADLDRPGFDRMDLEAEIDPAALIDADSSGVKPVEVGFDDSHRSSNGGIAAETALAEAEPTGPVPAGLVDQTGPLPADIFGDDTGPIPATPHLDQPPPPVADTLSVDDALADISPVPAAETIISDAPPSPGDGADLFSSDTRVVQPPMAEAPVVDPPPPLVGDPAVPIAPNGNDPAAGGALVSARAGSGGLAGTKGELAAKMPSLLDPGFLRRTRRLRARKVRRVVRHIDPWSVLTFSVLFFLCLFASLLLASVLVWNAAVAAGTIENIESFIREIGDYQTYEINGDVVFRAAMVIAGILTLAASVMVVLLVVVFNLISDLVGGIRLTVVEEEVVRVRRRRNE